MSLRVGVVSLGCVKNLVDTELMLGLLDRAGFEITSNQNDADVLIVNTCGFITEAKEESISTILKMARSKVTGRCRVLLVAGCLAQRYGRELLDEMPEVDGVMGTGDVSLVVEVVRRTLAGERVGEIGPPGFLHTYRFPRVRATAPHLAYVKIAEGCDNRCAYCAIPAIRGPYRSRRLEDIEAEVRSLAAAGVKEIIIVAQDTTRYGYDLYGRLALPDLLRRLVAADGLQWIRLMYCYPDEVTEELIEVMAAEKKICRYIDLPLQHASDEILKRMNRRGTRRDIESLIRNLRSAIEGLTLRTTFIVGLPGEEERHFQELLEFMAEVKFERVGIFKYSPEEGTPAADMPGQVPEEVKKERFKRAMKLQRTISMSHNRSRIGLVMPVLVEAWDERRKMYRGRSEGDAPEVDGNVYLTAPKPLRAGEMVNVRITAAREYDLVGELVS